MKLKGKLIGGILGACFGGPFGIALGVAIGHVCDSVADSSEVSLAARSKFIELACEGISKIAKADSQGERGGNIGNRKNICRAETRFRYPREGCWPFQALEEFQ